MDTANIDFLVIGAQKCATSWLYYCLKDHPEIHMPKDKREIYYLGGDLYQEKGANWYFSSLKGSIKGQKTGDVSVQYLFDKRSPKVVYQYLPQIKIIISLRNPVERALSAYYWYYRKGKVPREPIFQNGIEKLINAYQKDSRLSNAVSFYAKDIVERGFYDEQIKRYQNYFSPQRTLYILHEDIKIQPRKEIRRLYRFLDVDSNYKPKSLKRKPKRTFHFKPLLEIERTFAGNKIVEGTINLILEAIFLCGLKNAKPNNSIRTINRLHEIYLPHIQNTQKILETAPNRPRNTNLIKKWSLR